MIKKIKETLSQVFFSPEATGSWDGDDITVNMDGGVGGSWTVNDEEDGLDYEDQYYTGVPAPAYLEIDPWFSPPVLSEKQMTYKEAYDAAVADQQIADEIPGQEPSDIHQRMYEIATQNSATTLQLDPPGGSENVWMSGTGMNQFK
jgi:hypothetical protein